MQMKSDFTLKLLRNKTLSRKSCYVYITKLAYSNPNTLTIAIKVYSTIQNDECIFYDRKLSFSALCTSMYFLKVKLQSYLYTVK